MRLVLWQLLCPIRGTALFLQPLRRIASLAGKSIGLIDNIKPNANLFIQYIEEMLRAEYPDARTQTVRKNFTSSRLIADQLDGKVDALVNAWGD